MQTNFFNKRASIQALNPLPSDYKSWQLNLQAVVRPTYNVLWFQNSELT